MLATTALTKRWLTLVLRLAQGVFQMLNALEVVAEHQIVNPDKTHIDFGKAALHAGGDVGELGRANLNLYSRQLVHNPCIRFSRLLDAGVAQKFGPHEQAVVRHG